jgi:hypothetical protein
MWLDILLFILLALLTNTAFPLSFDPILIYFAAGYPLQQATFFAIVGSLCAGIAGVADVKLLGKVRSLFPKKWGIIAPNCKGRWFYVWVSLLAFSPIPFSFVRLFILRRRPDPSLYGLAVGIGRLPRYLLTVYFWQSLTLPAWVNSVLLLSVLLLAFFKWLFSRQSLRINQYRR